MSKRTFIYRKDKDGKYKAIQVDNVPKGKWFEPEGKLMSETVLRGYYEAECEQGSRFRSGYSPKTIRKLHETKIECQKSGREWERPVRTQEE